LVPFRASSALLEPLGSDAGITLEAPKLLVPTWLVPTWKEAAYRRRMEFRLLGPLEVSHGDRSLRLGGPKQRTVLAHLLLHANRLVTVERLIDALWGDEPPESARNTLQTYIKHLRKLIGGERIEHMSSGYLLRADPHELDVLRFEALVEEARGSAATDVPGAAKGLREALGVWRGPALDDLAQQPSLRHQISRLEEMRVGAIEDRISADLALGRHHDLVPELETLIGQHPYRERSWGHLMTALYRSGRQGDALAAYQRAREVLRDELGIDPSPELQHLHEQILRQDPALELGGEVLRGYRLLEPLGEGAFGAVHRAFQPGVGREVAVKVIHPRLANDLEFIRRFDVEAQLVARLEHPHIVPVYDYWRDPDGAYLVMRYLRGGSLRQVLTHGPLEPDRAAKVIGEVAQALAAAHRQGVVHRDVQPANILFDEEGNTYLSDFGIARDLATARIAGEPGTPGEFAYYFSPEEARGETPTQRADTYSLGLVLYECLTGRRAVGDSPPDEVLERKGRVPIPSVGSIRPDLPVTVDAVIAQATAEDPTQRYPEILAFAAAAREVLDRAAPAPAGIGDVELRNPYKGLRAFPEADAADFFGRENLVDRLVARLGEEGEGRRFLAVVGPSGSGKSSVVRAGLIPRLREGALPGSDTWFFVEIMPGAHPLDEVEAALLRIATNPPPDLIDLLDRDEHGLLEAADRVLPQDRSQLFLVVDQLEELFTHVNDEELRARFLAALVTAVEDPRSRIRVLVTLRADFYDRPLIYRGFGELLASRIETVTPLTTEELERAIAGPAQRVGVKIEAALLAQTVTDASNRFGALPFMQYALTEVFERSRGGTLTIADYHDLGGITGALAGRAESLLSARREQSRETIRQMFLRLVHFDEGSEDVRRRVRRSELDSLEGDREAMTEAIDAFTNHRLLTSDRDPVTREPTVEVAHEALLRSWPRLRGWIDSAREDVRSHRRLAIEAAQWEDAGRDPSFVLRGSRLEGFEAWAAGSGIAFNSVEREYLEASVREREVERAAEEARRQREMLLERRSARRIRALVAVLTAAAVVATGLAVVANGQRERAALEARRASARELAAAAVANLDVDPERSILLAVKAVERTRSVDGFVLPEAEEALHQAVTASRLVRWLPVDAQAALDWSPTGDFVAMGADNTGRISIRNAETGDVVLTFQGPSAPITDVAFSPDGSMLATASDDGRIAVWDATNGKFVGGMSGDGSASGPSFSADGSLVAGAWSEPGIVKILDLSTGTVTDSIRSLPGASHTALDPRGRGIAVATEADNCDGEQWQVLRIDLHTGGRLVLNGSEPCGAHFVSWSPDGRYIAANADVANVKLWDGTSGELRFTLVGHTDEVLGGDWSSDSSLLVTGAYDNTAKVWAISAGGAEPLYSLTGLSTQTISEVAFSPDDEHVMTKWGGSRGVVRIWDVSPWGGAEVTGFPASAPGWWWGNVAFLDERRVVLPNGSDRLAVWDVQTGQEVGTIGPRLGPSNRWESYPRLDVSTDGSIIAIARGDQIVSLWDTTTGERLVSVEEPRMHRFDLSSSGRYLAIDTGGWGTAEIVNRTGRSLRSVGAPDGLEISDVQLSPDEDLLALATLEEVAILDWERGTVVATIPTQTEDVAFDHSGRLIATAGDDRTPEIWKVDTGELVATLSPQPGDIYGLGFSPDGSLLAVGSADGTIRLFDARSGRLVTLPSYEQAVGEVAFSPDGSLLAVTTADGQARIWSLDLDDLLHIAQHKLTRSFTEEECRLYLHVETCPKFNG